MIEMAPAIAFRLPDERAVFQIIRIAVDADPSWTRFVKYRLDDAVRPARVHIQFRLLAILRLEDHFILGRPRHANDQKVFRFVFLRVDESYCVAKLQYTRRQFFTYLWDL